jgi:hypothetical protein
MWNLSRPFTLAFLYITLAKAAYPHLLCTVEWVEQFQASVSMSNVTILYNLYCTILYTTLQLYWIEKIRRKKRDLFF